MSAPWQWLSFCDTDKPEGQRFIGVAIVRGWSVADAALMAHVLGCNPGGQVMAVPAPEHFGDPPIEWQNKLVTDKAEIERLTEQWCGDGRCSTIAEIEAEDAS